MSHKMQIGRTWAILLPLALVLVLAAPAGAKGPVFNQPLCPPTIGEQTPAPRGPALRPPCERLSSAGDPHTLDGANAGLVAAGIAALVLALAVGMLVVTHRADAPARPEAGM